MSDTAKRSANVLAPVTEHRGIRPSNIMELERFATMAAKSNLVPRDYQGRPDNIMVAIQMGSELGLAPMQSLQNISVINGRPAVWGDAMLGLCRASPFFEDIRETLEGAGEERVALCLVRRRGSFPVTGRFSVAQAKQAGLWDKTGPWKQYPERMLQMRARGFALRDAFPDVLRGLVSGEEARDMTAPTLEGAPEETPPTATTAPAPATPDPRREEINAATPMEPTAPEQRWLDKLDAALGTVTTTEGWDNIMGGKNVRDFEATASTWGRRAYYAVKQRHQDRIFTIPTDAVNEELDGPT